MIGQHAFQALALPNIPLIHEGDDLVQVILEGLISADLRLQDNDIVVISSKIVSKSEGRFLQIDSVIPSEDAISLASIAGKDPRLVEIILGESTKVSRIAKGVIVTQHRLGFVSANAGIDQSNVDETQAKVLLLPLNPDESARNIRSRLLETTGANVAVVITDTHGRPFRMGNVGVAIGVAGLQAVDDRRGEKDLFGRTLVATVLGYADLIASTAHLLTGEGAEGRPLVLIRGLDFPHGEGKASDLNRPPEHDLYR